MFLDHPLSCSVNLFGRLLPGWAKWVIMIGLLKLNWLHSFGLLLLLLLYGDGGLISRRGSTEVDWLAYIVTYCSFKYSYTITMHPFAGLPVL